MEDIHPPLALAYETPLLALESRAKRGFWLNLLQAAQVALILLLVVIFHITGTSSWPDGDDWLHLTILLVMISIIQRMFLAPVVRPTLARGRAKPWWY